MNSSILHGVEITDRAGKLDCILTPSKSEALSLARQLYARANAKIDRWTCFYVRYTKRGTYSRLEEYELIPQP